MTATIHPPPVAAAKSALEAARLTRGGSVSEMKLVVVLERRIQRLNDECAVAPQKGLSKAPFVRRARRLSDTWMNLKYGA